MKARSGASHKRRAAGGYAGLAAVLLVTGLAFIAVLLAPNLTKSRVQARLVSEDRRLQGIADQLVKSIRATQYIPGATNWSSTLASFSGLNQTSLDQVYAEFPTDTTTRRVLLIDPALGTGSLPYSQGLGGLLGVLTNLAEANSRVLLISNTRRGLALPVSNGLASSTTAFNAIWDWTHNPATKAPPSGWPSSWNGYGDELHVARINLANLFHTVSLNNLRYFIDTNRVSLPIQATADLTLVEDLLGTLTGPLSEVTRLILSPTEMKVLDGTMLKIYETNGNLFQVRRITGKARYELTSTNAAPPILRYQLSELSGSAATNSGTFGSLWNGVYTNGVTLGVSQPRPPSYPSFPTNNYSVYFEGSSSYIETGRKMTNTLPAFTLAAWIRPERLSSSTLEIAGVRNSLSLNMYTSRRSRYILRIYTRRGRELSVTYPYPLNEWHHVAAVGTGTQLRLYIDGRQIGTRSGSTANYYYDSGYTFRIATGPRSSTRSWGWGSWSYSSSTTRYKGWLDEVVFYNRAIGTNEIAALATGVIP